ncbi:hypothetical protein HAX54_021064, partial [Datura stramonium]|nr:hypothetical protein [Datura stramonium]
AYQDGNSPMHKLLGGLPRPSSTSMPSSAAAADPGEMHRAIATLAQAYVELQEDLEKEKKKRRSRDKLLVHKWKGVKEILKHLFRGTRTPQATKRDLLEFSLAVLRRERPVFHQW